VLHENAADGTPWTIIQYHFFYAFNDWRLAANGMNHHEGDWEMLAVYLKDDLPFGVFFSQHGAGYLESWDRVHKARDKQGRLTAHPVVFAALGSHANYARPEVIRSASHFQGGWVQRILYWSDGLLHFIFLLFNPNQAARQLALQELHARSSGILTEEAFADMRDEADHYLVSLPLEIASGDGFRIGPQGDPAREGMVKSSSYLKRIKSERPVTLPGAREWRRVILDPEPGWVQYKGRWGVRSFLERESGPSGPKWDRSSREVPPVVRSRWGHPMDWVDVSEDLYRVV
jgi:hypothetical protein